MTDDLTQALRDLIAHLQAHQLDYMLVGSIAALAYGRSRSTQDFDIVVDGDGPSLHRLIRALPEERFYASEQAATEAVRYQTQFNVIDMNTGWKADIIPKKRRAFSESEFGRRRKLEVLGLALFVASIEDTIVAKLEWAKAGGGSQRQLEDVTELWRLGGATLDRAYVRRWVSALDLQGIFAQAQLD